jgi:hypothetical protein
MGGCLLTRYDTARGPHTEMQMQADVLDRRPDNGQTTGFGREGINLGSRVVAHCSARLSMALVVWM